jgi:hypothetical protein
MLGDGEVSMARTREGGAGGLDELGGCSRRVGSTLGMCRGPLGSTALSQGLFPGK